jgi:hypothetical protein
MVPRVFRELREKTELMVPRVFRELREKTELMVPRVFRALLELQELVTFTFIQIGPEMAILLIHLLDIILVSVRWLLQDLGLIHHTRKVGSTINGNGGQKTQAVIALKLSPNRSSSGMILKGHMWRSIRVMLYIG